MCNNIFFVNRNTKPFADPTLIAAELNSNDCKQQVGLVTLKQFPFGTTRNQQLILRNDKNFIFIHSKLNLPYMYWHFIFYPCTTLNKVGQILKLSSYLPLWPRPDEESTINNESNLLVRLCYNYLIDVQMFHLLYKNDFNTVDCGQF